jgi:hypothetical protein
MTPELEAALVKALQDLATGQKQLTEEIKTLKGSGELTPITMPDGSVRLVPKDALVASTKTVSPGKVTVVESKPITKEPWPDPNQPKPTLVR